MTPELAPVEPEEPAPDVREEPQPPGDPFAPRSFAEFVGQEEAKRVLRAAVLAARRTGSPLPHVLLYGPPGVGKSALVHVLAQEMGGLPVYESSGAELATQQDLILTMARIGEWWARDGRPIVWLIDEVDGIPRVASYAIHSLMTHGWVTWKGRRYGGASVTVAATTNHAAAVPAALFDRFQVVGKLGYYGPDELAAIAAQAARRRGIELAEDAAAYIGANGGGEPRKVVRSVLLNLENLLAGRSGATLEDARQAVELAGLRPGGLTGDQVGYLSCLSRMPRRTAGLASIAAYLGEPVRTVQFHHEPYLIRSGLATVTRNGRAVTDRGLEYLTSGARA